MKKEEWLPLVNEKGEVIGQAPRSICHSGSKLLHPVVHLHIINDQREIFLQKRSMKKDLLPGKWDTAVGGHIGLNEKVEDALKRETCEELGITDFEARFMGSYIWESPREKELVFSFICTRYNTIRIDNDEVDEGRFWNKTEIEKGIQANLLTPNLIHEYNNLLLKQLNN
ncbi:MAG: NUDIX domain-containing protein [Odoribacter sp.]